MLKMFGKMFGNTTSNAAAGMAKSVNRDLMQGIVAGGLYVASASGTIEDGEIRKLEELLNANENMKHLGAEIQETIQRMRAKFQANFQVGRLAARRELEDIANNKSDAEEAFVNILAVALADGSIDGEEAKALKEIAGMFGLRLESYGVQLS